MKLGMFIVPTGSISTAYLIYPLISDTNIAASKIVEAITLVLV
jgi:hypothetical protein